MDSRWRFLHCCMTELWGRMGEAWAGRGKTGASAAGGVKAKPYPDPRALGGAKGSSEACDTRAEKSRYSSYSTRTVNRHRWMGRESQGRREKHCQGTRQNDPVTSGEGVPR